MLRWILALIFAIPAPLMAGTAADIARAIKENSFDRDECYRVRDLTLFKEDLRIYLTEGHLIFSKPIAGRRIAAVFTTDVEGGDGEVILLPPDRAERRSLASYINSPNLDEHFKTALFLFTGDDYERLKAQFANSPGNKKAPEMGPVLDDEWTPALRNLGVSYVTRLTFDLMTPGSAHSGVFAGLFSSSKIGNFDVSFDPANREQIIAGQVNTRNNVLFFDVWTSFASRSSRKDPVPPKYDILLHNYRIESTISPDLSMSTVTKVKVKPVADNTVVTTFEISPQMQIAEVTVDGKPAEVLQRDSLRLTLARGGNNLILVVPPEPLRANREYEFEFHHSGKVIFDAGEGVMYVTARGTWYPSHHSQFADYDLQFRYPKDLDLVTPGEVVEDRTDGEWRITRRRTGTPIRMAAFNLGSYEHVHLEKGGYVVDVCANRALEKALMPRPQTLTTVTPPIPGPRRLPPALTETQIIPPPPDPKARLQTLAGEVASALEFMASKFGPPTLPHLTVSPIPGTFGQGFPGLVYLSTISYLKNVPGPRFAGGESQEYFFQDVLQAHETAHQWWGNRVTAASYRDYWLMEALANYSALAYLEKSKGAHETDVILDSYRTALLAKGDNGQIVDSTGPIVLGTRLENSQEPRAWRSITYGKGSWIMQMLRRRIGDDRFTAMLAELVKRYDRQELSTEAFRLLAAEYLPPKSEDPKLETFFDQWVYGTGIPNLKLTYSLKGKAPALKLTGTITQTEVEEDFSALVPVEIQVARGKSITKWVETGNTPVTFTVPLTAPPVKVALDPHHGLLRR